MVEQHDVARQVPVDRSQPVGHPRAQAGKPLAQEPRVHLEQARPVREAIGIHAADDGDVVEPPGEVREQVGDDRPGFSVPGELTRRSPAASPGFAP